MKSYSYFYNVGFYADESYYDCDEEDVWIW